jgi:membrane protease YdiL (CAAX protease family)
VVHIESAQGRAPLEGLTQDIVQAKRQFTLRQIIGLWTVAAVPIALLAWFVVPAVVDQINLPAVITYWLILMVGMLWQTMVSLWVISRQEGNLRWETIRNRTWLNRPRDPKTGQLRVRLLWRLLPYLPVVLVSLGVGVLTPVWLMLLRFLGLNYFDIPILRWPAYANVTELVSPEFTGQWWLVIAALLGWVLSALFAEELLFRGVLLPRMTGVFGKRDWVANAVLYALYHLFQFWMIPFRLVEGLIISRHARRFSSNWMAVAIRGVEGLGLLALVVVGITAQPLTASPTPITFPYISRRPTPWVMFKGSITVIPTYDPTTSATFQVDLRGADLSALNLRNTLDDLAYADFDTRTIWPAPDQMPAGFDPAQILELGKNPGLEIHSLHAQGITGRGVGVAIIDQQLLTEHKEYADRLQWYEEIPSIFEGPAQMHGPAVASIAVGRTVGVAPEADLYYIGGPGGSLQSPLFYGHDYAQAIRRILQINEQLPAERRIRAISISTGWPSWMAGHHDAVAAVREAEAKGLLVVNVGTGTGLPNNVWLRGLGRPLTADPDIFESYEPGIFWAREFYAGSRQFSRLLVPMDSRTVASQTGPNDYAFSRVGGGSWVPPYIAGLYALAAQADPTITPERFWSTALGTGRAVEVEHEGRTFSLDTIIDPVALINELRDN